ncbi:MAG: glycine--tRNA ligase [Candidatus Hadarchaeia archaeon]
MTEKYEKIMKIAKRRGFIWPSFEPYGGVAGFYDFGPLGSLLKQNLLDKWRQYYVREEGFFEIDSPTVFPEEMLRASGHVDHFNDVMVSCPSCGSSYEVTELVEEMTGIDIEGKSKDEMKEIIDGENVVCPKCGGPLGGLYDFNTMFETAIGPEKDRKAYLRPETAQSIFVDFNRLKRVARKKLPFGVVQIGKGYRNEISPRKGIIRLREFTMAEAEIFFDPEKPSHKNFDELKNDELRLWLSNDQMDGNEKIRNIKVEKAVQKGFICNELMAYHLALANRFFKEIGIPSDMLRFREQVPGERAHYSEETWDSEIYTERFGWVEAAGFAYRTDYDLSQHTEYSNEDMTMFYQEKGEAEGKKLIPHVVEPSYGIDRCIYGVLEHSFSESDEKTYFEFEKDLAPLEVSVFPLITDDGLPERAEEVVELLQKAGLNVEYDDSGSIGRRYARADEVGTPYCVTVDHQSLDDSTVTIRDRDTTEQIRVEIENLPDIIGGLLDRTISFDNAGDKC